MAKRYAENGDALFAAAVLAGYDDTHIRQPGLTYPRDNGLTYNETWEAAIQSEANWVLICSWNDWHEGSEIEPSLEHGHFYLELIAHNVERFKNS